MTMRKRTTHRDRRLDVGVLIGMERESLNLSQTATAASCGVSQTTWNHWEKGLRFPNEVEFARIVEIFDLPATKTSDVYRRSWSDWKRLGAPAVTRTYRTPGGTSTDRHPRERSGRSR